MTSSRELKESLARRFATDTDAYSNGKSEFIREVERRAVAWRHSGEAELRSLMEFRRNPPDMAIYAATTVWRRNGAAFNALTAIFRRRTLRRAS